MEIPEIKFSEPLLIGIAITASVLAIVLYYENRKLSGLLAGQAPKKKPCGCRDPEPIVEIQDEIAE